MTAHIRIATNNGRRIADRQQALSCDGAAFADYQDALAAWHRSRREPERRAAAAAFNIWLDDFIADPAAREALRIDPTSRWGMS